MLERKLLSPSLFAMQGVLMLSTTEYPNSGLRNWNLWHSMLFTALQLLDPR